MAGKAWPISMNVQCIFCCTGPAVLLQFEVFIREASYFKAICQAFGALMFLLAPKGGDEGRGIVYFYVCYLPLLHLRLSDSTMSEDAGIEPGTVAALVLTARRSNYSVR
jgi:hypothetical protein